MKTTTTTTRKPSRAQLKREATATARARHHAALEVLCPIRPGAETWALLRRIETKAARAATAQCNGQAYQGQPFRPDYLPDGSEGTEEQPTPWDVFTADIYAKVANVFGGSVPDGFRYNQDPRGYALKIDPDKAGKGKAAIPAGMVTDWGGNGCLAAAID